MPKAYLGRRYHFAAAHRLHSAALDAERNREVYGKCNNPHGHGHNYTAEIVVAGEVDAVTGMVCDLAEMDAFAQARMVEVFDHQNLNTLERFRNRVPTTENLCMEIYRIFQQGFHGARLVLVRVEETERNSFEYAGERETT
jgi:6-pyruvoyltetrahydropterin/6-carboxytetrahydropterin synthase